MTIGPALLDLGHPPDGLAELADWFDAMSTGLVLLEPYPLPDIRRAAANFRDEVRMHTTTSEARIEGLALPPDRTIRSLREIVRSDHRWFEISFEQLDWFLAIAEKEGHGGNRQALGQYGRLLAEAMRRHLADEGRLEAVGARFAGKP